MKDWSKPVVPKAIRNDGAQFKREVTPAQPDPIRKPDIPALREEISKLQRTPHGKN